MLKLYIGKSKFILGAIPDIISDIRTCTCIHTGSIKVLAVYLHWNFISDSELMANYVFHFAIHMLDILKLCKLLSTA